MGRSAQVIAGWGRRVFRWLNAPATACLIACASLGACGTKGFSIEDAVPDTSLVTNTVPSSAQSPAASDVARISDEATIRAAVSSAIVDEIGETGIGWANAGTGSRGAIRDVRETRDSGYLCRSFVASRESFDGINMYRGETCLGPARVWTPKSFELVR